MIKSIKIIIFLALTPGLIIANTQKMAFLKEKLIVTPKEQAASKGNILKKLLPAAILPVLFDFCFLSGIKFVSLKAISELKALPNLTPEMHGGFENMKLNMEKLFEVASLDYFPGIRSLIIYCISHKIILRRLENACFMKFINDWEYNKSYTPAELHYSFEQLHSKYKHNKLIS